MGLNLKFFNGFGGLVKKIGLKLTQLSPLYILIFIAYGDNFLPKPLSDASFATRNTINRILTGLINDDMLENTKYDHKKTDQVIEKTEKDYLDGKKN